MFCFYLWRLEVVGREKHHCRVNCLILTVLRNGETNLKRKFWSAVQILHRDKFLPWKLKQTIGPSAVLRRSPSKCLCSWLLGTAACLWALSLWRFYVTMKVLCHSSTGHARRSTPGSGRAGPWTAGAHKPLEPFTPGLLSCSEVKASVSASVPKIKGLRSIFNYRNRNKWITGLSGLFDSRWIK